MENVRQHLRMKHLFLVLKIEISLLIYESVALLFYCLYTAALRRNIQSIQIQPTTSQRTSIYCT
jgi:hypothetical protein